MYAQTYTIAYQDVDASRRIRLFTFISRFILQTAGQAADVSGFGIRDLLPLGWTWIITRLQLQLDVLPTHAQQLRVETWIERQAHMLSNRNFRFYLIQDNQSILIGQAKTVWTVLDLQKREIVNAFSHPMFQDVTEGPELYMPKNQILSPKRASTSEQWCEQPEQVRYSDVDYNGHCNSCQYIQYMLNAYHPQWLDSPFMLEINYVHELKEKAHFITRYSASPQVIYYQQIDEKQALCCSAKLSQFVNGGC